jgi:hypothetical protein
MAISLRLDGKLARKVAAIAKARGLSTSDLIRQCLGDYLERQERKLTAWELGQGLFACYDSGQGDLSSRAKQVTRERIHARRASKNRD